MLFSSTRTGIIQGNWEKQEQQPAPGLVLGTCVRWDTAGLEELKKGSGDAGESNEGVQVVHVQSHSLSSVSGLCSQPAQ